MATRKATAMKEQAIASKARVQRARMGGLAKGVSRSTSAVTILGGERVSELWQRLRAARAYAEMSQQALADMIGVTRSGVSFWESDNELTRTWPSVSQVTAYAAITRVPVQWLVDDSQDHTQLEAFMKAYERHHDGAAAIHYAKQAARFWQSVRVGCEKVPGVLERLDKRIEAHGAEFTIAMMEGGTMVHFAATDGTDPVQQVAREVSHMLMLEKAMARRLEKTLLFYATDSLSPACKKFASALGVTLRVVSDASSAARLLART